MTVLYGNLIYVRILFHLDRAVFCEGIGPEDLSASGNDQFASRRLTEGKKPGTWLASMTIRARASITSAFFIMKIPPEV